MTKIQFAMSIAPEKGYLGIGYNLRLHPMVVRLSPNGFEVSAARPFEEINVVPGIIFHAIPGLDLWETEAASTERLKTNHLPPFTKRIPVLPLLTWTPGEVINNATHFVSYKEDISSLVPTALAPVSFLVFAGSEAECQEYLTTHPQKRKEIYKIVPTVPEFSNV